MKNKLEKKWVSKQTMWIISLLATADVLVFIFPSYLKNVINQEVIAMNLGISNSQLGQATAIYGYISLAIYFFGSIVGDKFSLKWLTIIGLSIFGISGIWYGMVGLTYGGGIVWDNINDVAKLNSGGQTERFVQVMVIYSIWAVGKIIFWAPLWKLLSQQGKQEENGMLNGVHGSLNGFIGTIFVAFGFALFTVFTPIFVNETTYSTWAFTIMCWIFCGLIGIDVILLILFVKEQKSDNKIVNEFSIKDLKEVLKNGKVWLLSFVIMGVYMYQSGLSILVPFMNSTLIIATIIVFVAGLLRTYLFRFFFSAWSGKIADRSGKYIKFLMIGTIIATFLITISAILPGFKTGSFYDMSKGYKLFVQIVVFIFYLVLGAICWALVTNRWATIYEIGVSQKQYATAVGLISVIAFSPDAWFQQANASLTKVYKTPGFEGITPDGYSYQIAYQWLMLIIVIGGIIGIVSALILMQWIKREKLNKAL
ncbi:MFS transporter [Spiroplasma culicicola]|uniref:Glycerophosphodiester transporter n=1 Tax=Spiroplasma culicicola AES-1 TaxID=1276246 RepID=W6A5K5_9MOLU|nr:MFS transporter [Spiroplasma culicicola]AHI52413.1 glycerophosphodiester transporter [Spiroplasma culicicola AES-1]